VATLLRRGDKGRYNQHKPTNNVSTSPPNNQQCYREYAPTFNNQWAYGNQTRIHNNNINVTTTCSGNTTELGTFSNQYGTTKRNAPQQNNNQTVTAYKVEEWVKQAPQRQCNGVSARWLTIGVFCVTSKRR
jgi:hypothetical protein